MNNKEQIEYTGNQYVSIFTKSDVSISSGASHDNSLVIAGILWGVCICLGVIYAIN
jgi:hypothetical protein